MFFLLDRSPVSFVNWCFYAEVPQFPFLQWGSRMLWMLMVEGCSSAVAGMGKEGSRHQPGCSKESHCPGWGRLQWRLQQSM